MFPKSQHGPTFFRQNLLYLAISFSVTFDLGEPVFLVRLKSSLSLATPTIAVPKLAITKNCNSTSDEDKVWFPQDCVLLPIAKPSLPKCGPQSSLDCRPTRANARHGVMNLFPRRFPATRQSFHRFLHKATLLGSLHRSLLIVVLLGAEGGALV